jgi:hypothetical protein
MPSFRLLDAITRPKPRQPVAHAVGNGASISGDAGARELIGKSEGKTIKVRSRTLRGLQIAEGVINDVKAECVRYAGNQITDIHQTNGWSYLLAQTYRHREKSDSTLSRSDLVREAIQLKAGTCQTYALCAYVLTQQKCSELPEDDPLRSRPLHIVADSINDHTYVVWGKRAHGTTGKFEDEAIIIDAWPGLAKPFLKKESADKKNLDSLVSKTSTKGPSMNFNLPKETATTPESVSATKAKIKAFLHAREKSETGPRNLQEIEDYLDHAEGIPTYGPSLLGWVLQDQDRKDFIDDRVSFVADVSTRYVDKNGRYGTFDQLPAEYVHQFAQSHAAAMEGPLAPAIAGPPEGPAGNGE